MAGSGCRPRQKSRKEEGFAILLDAIRFDARWYAKQTAIQSEVNGAPAKQFVEESGAMMAVNGSFFEVDALDRLSPSGGLYISGHCYRLVSNEAGPGFSMTQGWQSRLTGAANWIP